MSGPFTPGREDRLYDLLPAVYRRRDEEQGSPLRALLRVISEQVNAVEDDIGRLYDNWFIETCQDWVVPYLGDLIGHRPVHEGGGLVSRREVANTLRNRQRKGTLALLESLAADVAGWPARAVEFYRLVAFTQPLNHLQPRRGRTVDLRKGGTLDRLDGPFDTLAHTVDVRRTGSRRSDSNRVQGRPNLPGVGLFLWRLRSYPVSGTPGYCKEKGDHHYTFSVLGNDAPLFVKPEPETDPTHIAEELNLPILLGRRAFEARKADYYGPGKSLHILRVLPGKQPEPIPVEEIVAADLSGWHYQPRKGQVAVDPELGRIAFPPRHVPKHGIRVFYHYGFSADIGGGEYDRPISQPADAKLFRVGSKGEFRTIEQALASWHPDKHPDKHHDKHHDEPKPQHAVIEITDSRDYVEQINITLHRNETLQLRAAPRTRPVIRLLDRQTSARDSLTVEGEEGSAFTLDGLLITGRGVRIEGALAAVTVRHTTLVPGWGLHGDCAPREPAEPSLELVNVRARVAVEHSIVGSIVVNQDEVGTDPVPLRISDSIVDATRHDLEAVSGADGLIAHARLTVERSTVFGEVHVHALELGENSLFEGVLRVARRQIGCLRFSSYVPKGSRTPRRFECQPDLVDPGLVDPAEQARVRPRFRSTRYGSPVYARLAAGCATEIRRGAEDESEMGVFHDLYESQREANLRARLDEFTPAGVDAGLIFADEEAP